jgi:hypothetical protein
MPGQIVTNPTTGFRWRWDGDRRRWLSATLPPPTPGWGEITGDIDRQVDLYGALGDLGGRISRVATLGHYAGSFPTHASLPANVNAFSPIVPTINDFATVRVDETQDGATTRHIMTAVGPEGGITWTYDISYTTDISGKMSLETAATAGHLAIFNIDGQAVDAGLAPTALPPADVALDADTGTGTDITTPAVASTTIAAVLQTIWGKIRQLGNAMVQLGNVNQTIAGTKTFSTSPPVPAKNSAAAAASTTVVATEAQVALKQDALTGVASSTALLVQPGATGGAPGTRALNTLLLAPTGTATANAEVLMRPAAQGGAPTSRNTTFFWNNGNLSFSLVGTELTITAGTTTTS